jgi:glycosyltransferase involved in cell wall biosynthesis
MKVWIVEISDFLPNLDGDNRLFRAGMVAKALVERGHKVLWWTSTFNHQLRKQRFSESTTVDINCGYRIRLLYGPGYRRSISIDRIWHNRSTAKKFACEIDCIPQDERPDIIYTCLPTLEMCEKVVLYGIRHGIPVVVDIRDQWPDVYLSPFPGFLQLVIKLFLRSEFVRVQKILSRTNSIVGISESNLKWGLKIAKKKTNTYDKWFPLGFYSRLKKNSVIDKDDIKKLKNKYNIKDYNLVVTFIGSFSISYNFNTILEVAQNFSQQEKIHVKFIIVGNGEQEIFLKEKAKKLNNLILTGWCKEIDVDKILAISSVGLAPYKSQAMMTLPNKPFEYMAAKLPILSSLNGECRRLIQKESIGLYYASDSCIDLKEKILWFLSHPQETKAMGIRARNLFEEKFSADIIYPKMAEHLECIVRDKGIRYGK